MSVNDESAAQEQWTRCWLVSRATAGRATYSEAKAGRLNPDLAIDVSDDEIRVIDLKTNSLMTSARLQRRKRHRRHEWVASTKDVMRLKGRPSWL